MSLLENYIRIFSDLRQAVIISENDTVVFANTSLKSAIDCDPTGLPLEQVLPQELLDCSSDSFCCGGSIMDRDASMSVVRDGSYCLFFPEFLEPCREEQIISPHVISTLRSCAMGIKLSADRCFSMLENGVSPSQKHISVLYHYYYNLSRTISQVSNAGQIERTELSFLPTHTDLVKLCSDLTDTVSTLVADKGLSIQFQTTEPEAFAMVDSLKIERLLLNLFSNSIKSCSAGDSITLSLKLSGSKLILQVEDTGSGIPQEILGTLFTLPDGSVDLTNPNPGMGLGLFIAFGIARLHKGVLLIESRQGQGTRVWVTLPADRALSPRFKTPESVYCHSGASLVLTELADILDNSCFGPIFED